MRPQNLVLEILDAVVPHGTGHVNGVLLFPSQTKLRLVTFKNSTTTGERMLILPEVLHDKLRNYLEFVRPCYGMLLLQPHQCIDIPFSICSPIIATTKEEPQLK